MQHINPAWDPSLLDCPADFRLKTAYSISSYLNLQPFSLSYEYQTCQPQQIQLFSGLKQEQFFYLSLFCQLTKEVRLVVCLFYIMSARAETQRAWVSPIIANNFKKKGEEATSWHTAWDQKSQGIIYATFY